MNDKELIPVQIGLTGKLVTAYDSTKLIATKDNTTVAEYFKSLKNTRYTDNGIKGISGMTKINTSALSTHPKIRNIFQFQKAQPQENHVLVQAYNSDETESKVFRNTTAIPSQGDFNGTALFTDTSGAGQGRFSIAPQGHIAYCNNKETMVWGGDETEISSFVIYDPLGTFNLDYTEVMQNTLDDSQNIATIKTVVGGLDSNVLLLLHMDGADGSTTFTDSSPTTPHTVTAAGNAQIKTNQSKYGGSSGYFDGTGDWLTIPDNADFDLSGGIFTFDCWVRVADLTANRGICGQQTDSERYWQWYIDTNGAIKFKIYTSPTGVWTPASGGITVNTAVIPTAPNGYFYECTAVSGTATTGGVEPVWPTTVGLTIVDNPGPDQVTWTCRKVADITYTTINGVVSTNTWTHIAIVESGDKKYIFVNGRSKLYASDTNRVANMLAGNFHVGSANNGNLPFLGHIDEFRFSNVARYTSDFEPLTYAYSTDGIANIRVGNTMPIQSIKFYVKNANTNTGTMTIYEWNGSGWSAVSSLVDGTAVGGIPLAQTGTVTFASTANTAKVAVIDEVYGYFYRIEITRASDATTVSRVTVGEPFQQIRDFWDGNLRSASSVQLYDGAIYKDNTVNVFEDDYTYDTTTDGDLSSYMIMNDFGVAGALYLGFNSRLTGIQVKLIPGYANTASSGILTIYYYNGQSWVSVGAITDGTIQNNASFGQSGFITWNQKQENVEFKTTISKEEPLYYYKLQWSAQFVNASGIFPYYIAGIPAQKRISNYKFPLYAQNRLWLFSDQSGRKNIAVPSNLNTFNVFNGSDSGDPFEFGDETEVMAAIELFSRVSTGSISMILVCKRNETFIIDGYNPETWKVIQLSDSVGCTAPKTLVSSSIGLEYLPLQSKHVAIWQASSGIYAFDGSAIFPISDDIANFFDRTKSEAINQSKIAESVGFFDNEKHEYHWCFASGASTTLNKELVFDLRRQKWFEVDRGTGKYLQCGVGVKDTNGNDYTYGTIDTGYIERLENGTTFDGDNIVSEFQTPDIAIRSGSVMHETRIRTIELPMVAKTVTTNNVTCTHYGDAQDTGTSLTISPRQANARIAIPSVSCNLGDYIFHSIKASMTTNNETIGFEPLYLGVNFKITRQVN